MTPYHIIASYLFIPSYDGMGEIAPILPVGWTLSYEMLFYLLFALALFLRANVLKVLLPILGVLALVSPFRDDSWPAVTDLANTLELEFVAGVCLAMLVLQGRRLRDAWAWPLLCAGFAAIAVLPELGRDMRVITWGLPALAIVAAAVSLEARLAGFLPRWLLFLGDASYSIYLVHFLITSGSAAMLAQFHVAHPALQPVLVLFCLVVSSVLGGAIHILIERPITDRLKRIGRPAASDGGAPLRVF
jgi:peptidoglycan/LPS O-acetylase OafA/YrhL